MSSATLPDRTPPLKDDMSEVIRCSQRAHWSADQPISALMARAFAQPELISLAAGFVDQGTLPVEPTRQALDTVMADPALARQALQYGTTPGHGPLREALLARALAADGVSPGEASTTIDQLVVTAGSNQFLHLVCDTLLDPGDLVLCTSPTYFVFLGMLKNVGALAVGVDMDEDGMLPDALEEQLKRLESAGDLNRVKAIYVVSSFDNPSSVTLAAERRQPIVEIAHRWSKRQKIYVIEDAAYRELRYFGDDIPSLKAFDTSDAHVISAGTFSKSYSPGIRVGWGLLPPELVGPVCDQKGNIDFGSPNFSQYVMEKVLTLGLLDPHIERLRNSYREKLEAMVGAADEFLAPLPDVSYSRPQGGLYVWLKVPEHIDTGMGGPLFEAAIEEGTFYVPGQYCYPSQEGPLPRNHIRLSFGVQSPENIRRGMEMLAKALRRVMNA